MRASPTNVGSSPVELVLVAHNEEATIARTISDFLAAARTHGIDLEILVAEDGSSDRTREVVGEIAERSSGRVRLSPPAERKGYSRAVVDAFRLARRAVVVFCDGDGQYEADDLATLLAALSPGTIVAGARSPRRDSTSRILMSRAFGGVYRLLIGLRMKDPSSPFVAASRRDVLEVLPEAPLLSQGFWWEFFARADAAGLAIVEVPVTHRPRDEGKTQIYGFRLLPQVALSHLLGLVKLRSELKRARTRRDARTQVVPTSVVKPR